MNETEHGKFLGGYGHFGVNENTKIHVYNFKTSYKTAKDISSGGRIYLADKWYF